MNMQRLDGFFLIKKEKGWTSRDVCNKIRHLFHYGKVGHSGTLDPFATGLLIVAVNKASKALSYVYSEPKTYLAKLKLGVKTSTGDETGEVIDHKSTPKLSEEMVNSILQKFVGESQQIPPMTSAIHVDGVKLYTLAHQGIEIERKPRNIKVFSMNLVKIEDEIITFECSVSSGTYIRVLGEDIASKLNTFGHLISLERKAIHSFDLSKAKRISEIQENDLLPIQDFVDLPKFYLTKEQFDKVKFGNPINLPHLKEDLVMLLYVDEKGNENVVAFYERKDRDLFISSRGII